MFVQPWLCATQVHHFIASWQQLYESVMSIITPVFLPGESPWTVELGGLQSMGRRVGQMTEWLRTEQHAKMKTRGSGRCLSCVAQKWLCGDSKTGLWRRLGTPLLSVPLCLPHGSLLSLFAVPPLPALGLFSSWSDSPHLRTQSSEPACPPPSPGPSSLNPSPGKSPRPLAFLAGE